MAFDTMANATYSHIPPLPSYTLTPRPSLVSGVPDIVLQLVMPVIAYWLVSLIFHVLDTYDLCAEYRLHTPAEVLKRNHVSRFEVLWDVVLQQIIQTAFGLGMAYFDPPEMMGKEQYDIAVWAQRLRRAEQHLPSMLALVGVDAWELAHRVNNTYPVLGAVLSGGNYVSDAFAAWELAFGSAMYWLVVPAIQTVLAICMVDTWQYFLHRAMHMNKFLYTTLHSRHHRLYVPYAYGALYNHPIEGFMLDILGTGSAYMVTGMTVRQGMWFFTFSTIKTVDDHCGYKFPWDPLQHVTSNNAAYHDIHHQSWGIKTNFSQPFFTFWDRILGTSWTGGDVSARYERDRIAAQKKVDADTADPRSSVTNCPATDLAKARTQAAASQIQVLTDEDNGGQQIIQEEDREEQEVKKMLRSPRRRTSGFDPRSTLSERVTSLHGRGTRILHTDGMH